MKKNRAPVKEMPANKPVARDDRSWYVWMVGVVLAAVVPYLPSLKYDMAVDDKVLVAGYPLSHGLSHFFQAFRQGFVPQNVDIASFYRPLVIASLQVNYQIAGEHPLIYHATNVLLYAVLALLVFVLARKLLKNDMAAGIAGLTFAVLPSHAESVAWISGRTDLLSVLFLVAGFVVFIDSVKRTKFSWPRAVLCSVLFLCALLSKENALIFPALLGLYVYVFGVKLNRRDALRWAAVLLPSLVLYLVLRKYALGVMLQQEDFFFLLRERMMGVGLLYASYLRMLFIPQPVHVVYDVMYLGVTKPALALAAWLLPVVLVVLTWKLRKVAPVVAFGAGWIFLTLLPVANIAPSPTNVPADRFSFMASLGSSLVLGWLIARMYQYRPQSLKSLPVLVWVGVCWFVLYSAALSVIGGRIYASDLAFAQAVTEANPRLADYHTAAALFYMESGLLDKAEMEYERAISRQPGKPDTYVHLATVRRLQGRMEEAIDLLTEAREMVGDNSDIEQELGVLYIQDKRYQEAADAFSRAVELDPKRLVAWRNLGRVSLLQREYEEAADAYQKALALGELDLRDRYDAGLAFKNAGLDDLAVEQFRAVAVGKDSELSAKARFELKSLGR